MRSRSRRSLGERASSAPRKISIGSTRISRASFAPLVGELDVDDAPIARGALAAHEPLALHAVDDAGHRAVLRADALGQGGERQVLERLQELEDGELGAGEPDLAGHALREPPGLGVEVDDRLDDLVHLGADGFLSGGGARHDASCTNYSLRYLSSSCEAQPRGSRRFRPAVPGGTQVSVPAPRSGVAWRRGGCDDERSPAFCPAESSMRAVSRALCLVFPFGLAALGAACSGSVEGTGGAGGSGGTTGSTVTEGGGRGGGGAPAVPRGSRSVAARASTRASTRSTAARVVRPQAGLDCVSGACALVLLGRRDPVRGRRAWRPISIRHTAVPAGSRARRASCALRGSAGSRVSAGPPRAARCAWTRRSIRPTAGRVMRRVRAGEVCSGERVRARVYGRDDEVWRGMCGHGARFEPLRRVWRGLSGRDEVCSGGLCGVECSGGTTLCGGACVDTEVDPAHCGDCPTACGSGESVGGRNVRVRVRRGGDAVRGPACVSTASDRRTAGRVTLRVRRGRCVRPGCARLQCAGGTLACAARASISTSIRRTAARATSVCAGGRAAWGARARSCAAGGRWRAARRV